MSAEQIKNNKNWQLLPAEGYITVRLMGTCEASEMTGFEAELNSLLIDPFPNMIVNCENLSSLSVDMQRSLLRIQVDLKKKNCMVRFINIKPLL